MTKTSNILLFAFAWFLITSIGFWIYVKNDWHNTIQDYEQAFRNYKLEKKSFKMAFRRVPSHDYMWRVKYLNEQTKNAFTIEELDCIKLETGCSPEERQELCEKLQALPNMYDCKSLKRMRDEFEILNRYMDSRLPPQKPKYEAYLNQHQNRHIIFALIAVLIPLMLLVSRKKLTR